MIYIAGLKFANPPGEKMAEEFINVPRMWIS